MSGLDIDDLNRLTSLYILDRQYRSHIYKKLNSLLPQADQENQRA